MMNIWNTAKSLRIWNDSRGQDMVEVTLVDRGEPFDLQQVPHLDPGELRVGGRGVYLMRILMDEISCQSLEGGHRLRLVKRWPSQLNVKECG